MAHWGLDRRQFHTAEIESLEIWGAGQRSLTGAPSSAGSSTMVADPFYESFDCPMFVDFTQPDRVREEDLQAWFEVYVDHEAGKPRSYPLFRDPAMDLALCELELERLLEATKLLDQLPKPQAPDTPPHSRSSLSSSDSPPGMRRSCSPDSVLRPSTSEVHKSKALLDERRVDRLKGLLKSDLTSRKAGKTGRPSELRAMSSMVQVCRPEPASAGPLSNSASESLKARRALPRGRSLEPGPSRAASSAAVLPTAVPQKKHFTLETLAESSEGGPPGDSRWQSPFLRKCRTTLRMPTTTPDVESNLQNVVQQAAATSVKQDGKAESAGIQFGDRRIGYDIQKVAERKARLREALRQKEDEEVMMWPQMATLPRSERTRRPRFHDHQQAPWVLAL